MITIPKLRKAAMPILTKHSIIVIKIKLNLSLSSSLLKNLMKEDNDVNLSFT